MGVVLLICGVVTYVAALQRYGTIDAVGRSLAAVNPALVASLLLCAIVAITSAVASTTAILGAMTPLAVPLMNRGEISMTGLVIALAISATVVDSTPFSTAGAVAVASDDFPRRDHQPRRQNVAQGAPRGWWAPNSIGRKPCAYVATTRATL